MKKFFLHFKTEMIVSIIFMAFALLIFIKIENIKFPIYVTPLLIIFAGLQGFIYTVGWKKSSWLFNFLRPKQYNAGTVVVVIDDRRGNVLKGILFIFVLMIRIYIAPIIGIIYSPILIYKYFNQ